MPRNDVSGLTPEEISAAKSSEHFGSTSWGLTHTGLCPIGKVAQLRGANFYYVSSGAQAQYTSDSELTVQASFDDVIHWLGFEDSDGYLLALACERECIFGRATY